MSMCSECAQATSATCASCGCETSDANPPGRTELVFGRSGHGAAFERMRQRLSSAELPALRSLTARRIDGPLDPAIALLDGWACLGHVLSFYNDRLVAEHYLRTCRQRRSAVELARLVGYAPRPGVAADAVLAFTLDDLDREATLAVPAGTRAFSQPGPGETMQPFETVQPLQGRPRWSSMRPRLTAPQKVGRQTTTLHLEGITTGLAKGDLLLLRLGRQYLRRTVAVVEVLPKENRTRVELENVPPPPKSRPPVALDRAVLESLLKPGSWVSAGAPPPLDPDVIFGADSYAGYGLLASAYPGLEQLDDALAGSAHDDPTGNVIVYAMRVKARLHGHNAQLIPWTFDTERNVLSEYREWNFDGTGPAPVPVINGPPSDPPEDPIPATGPTSTEVAETGDSGESGIHDVGDVGAAEAGSSRDAAGASAAEDAFTIPGAAADPLGSKEMALDAVYEGIVPGSLVAMSPEDSATPVHTVVSVRTTTRTAFNFPAGVTVLALAKDWRIGKLAELGHRALTVHAQNEALDLATMPLDEDLCLTEIELDGYYPGLQPGRLLIVTGERTDVHPAGDSVSQVTGVRGTELVVIAGVAHYAPGKATPSAGGSPTAATADTVHTVLTLAEPGLAYCYQRDSVEIFGNVAQATHGEGQVEVLGDGDATRPLQAFALKQRPLTYVPAATVSGVRSTLEIRVNDLRWQEAPHAAAVAPTDRRYVLRTDDEGGTSVVFGLGARLPTGTSNVSALYRKGLGKVGNVRAGQVSVLASRPNGVMGVTNPLATTGGADPEDLDAVRRRAPIGLSALDRLVSAADLEDFTRAFAGIGKARVIEQPGPPPSYQLVVAAEDDAPLTSSSSLIANLRDALVRYSDLRKQPPPSELLETQGTPHAIVEVAIRTALLIGVRARIRLHPDHVWEAVLPRLRTAMLTAFDFDSRQLGQVPYPGEAMAVMQAVRGVAWVDLLAFGTISTGTPATPLTPTEVADLAKDLFNTQPPGLPEDPPVRADQIAYLSPTAPGTLLLELDEAL